MNLLQFIIPVFAVAFLCAGWAAVQLLARKMGTKNHMDHGGTCGGGCGCSHTCERRTKS